MNKELIQKNINNILKDTYVCENNKYVSKLHELMDDIANDSYTVVVMGEFKRGKSTFINALLRTNLLPMNVIPETATINLLHYAEEPFVKVNYWDGRIEKGEVSYDYLRQFSATNAMNKSADVKYIEIGYPLNLLDKNITLVDTPGVSDINEQRCEVTYGFVPKANAVIFLLDAVAPLKATEKEFIEEKMLPLGVNNIIFVANKYDFVDEDDEEDVLGDLKIRLENAFNVGTEKTNIKEIEVYPLSALEAMRSVESNNERLMQYSGLPELEKRIMEMVSSTKANEDKISAYRNRLNNIIKNIITEIENDKAIKQADISEIQQINKKLESLMKQSIDNKESIKRYVSESKSMIISMADKSINYFNHKLQEEISEMIEAYQGIGFKEYIEHSVLRRVKNNFETWLGTYSPHIDILLGKMENELAQGMSYYFRQNIRIETDNGKEISTKGYSINITAEDVSSVNMEAGAMAAIGGIGLMAILGGAIMPLISFAALPFLRDNMLKKRLAMAKADVEPEIMSQIAEFSMQLKEEIHSYIDERCSNIIANSEYAYDAVLADCKQRIDGQIKEKKKIGFNIESDVKELESSIQFLQAFIGK